MNKIVRFAALQQAVSLQGSNPDNFLSNLVLCLTARKGMVITMKEQIKRSISMVLTTSLIMILVLPVISFAAIPGVTLPEFYDYEWTKSVVLGKSPIRQTCEHFQGFTLDWITDGDTKTSGLMNVGAAAPTEKGYVVYDLGETCKIGGATLDYNYRTAVGYNTLYGASDPEGTWTEILRFDDISGLANATDKVETKYFDKPADAPEYRYIKLEGEKPGGVYKINELEVYALLKVSLNLVETTPKDNEDYSEREITLDFDNNINLDSAKENIEVYKGETKLVCGDYADYTIALDEADATKVYITLKEELAYNVNYKVVIKNTLNSGKDGFIKFADGTQDNVINFKNSQGPLELRYSSITDGEIFAEKEITLSFSSKISFDSARNNIVLRKGEIPLTVDEDYTITLREREKTVKIELAKAPRMGYEYTLIVSKDINKVEGYIPFDESVVTEDIVYTFYNKQIVYDSKYLQDNEDIVEIETSALHQNSSNNKKVVINGNDYDERGLYLMNQGKGSYAIFDLKESIPVCGAKLAYNFRVGTGKVTIFGSNDKSTWKKLGTFDQDAELTADENGRMPEVVFAPEEYRYIKLEAMGDYVLMIFEFYIYQFEISDFVTPKLEKSDIVNNDVDIPYDKDEYSFSFCCAVNPNDINKKNITISQIKSGRETAIDDFEVLPDSVTDCDGFSISSGSIGEGGEYVIKIKGINPIIQNPDKAKVMENANIRFLTAKNYELRTPTLNAGTATVSVKGSLRTYHKVGKQTGVVIAALLKNGKFVEVKSTAFTAADIANGFGESHYTFDFNHTRTQGDTYTVKIYAVDGYDTIGKICEKQTVNIPVL